jgi:hypothetical protein
MLRVTCGLDGFEFNPTVTQLTDCQYVQGLLIRKSDGTAAAILHFKIPLGIEAVELMADAHDRFLVERKPQRGWEELGDPSEPISATIQVDHSI